MMYESVLFRAVQTVVQYNAVRVLWENYSHYAGRTYYAGLYYIMCHIIIIVLLENK